jgi:hypothetical protein
LFSAKAALFPSFAERNDHCTRQKIGFAESLARLALVKEFFLKKKKIFYREPGQQDSRQRFFFKKRKIFAESMAKLALGKEFFKKKEKLFVES